jgi:predicted nucleotidyltransferase
MPRAHRSDIDTLVQEVRAVEMLANEAEVEPTKLQDYWAIAADLITLSADIEAYQRASPHASYEDPALLELRRRLRQITSRLADVSTP